MNPSRFLHLTILMALLLAMLPAAAVTGPAVAQSSAPTSPDQPFVPGEVLVTLAPSVGASPAGDAQVSALAGQVGGSVVARYGGLALFSFDESADVQALSGQLAGQGNVITAQPNYVFRVPESADTRSATGSSEERARLLDAGHTVTVSAQNGASRTLDRTALRDLRTTQKRNGRTTSMSTFPSEYTGDVTSTWGWERVGATIIWQNSLPAAGVCLLDTGVDAKHKDLAGRIINGYDFINDDKTPNDDNGHGTHVAGTITALANNGASTAIGVSNGKVVAVKVLNAQGVGTSYAIAAGLYFCAGRKDVKVINMSLGGPLAASVEYDALKAAIVTNGKLVVAAAGNNYTADPTLLSYPAAWASADTLAPGAGANALAGGLISVAAARVYPPTYPVWVDTDGDNSWDANESFEYNDCALSFTDYGKTVTLVAPGHLIYSTTPTSYPFFNNYYYGDPAGYAYLSGTSMAAPFVAGGAARLLTARPDLSTPALAKQWIVEHSYTLTYAVDTNPNRPGFDPNNAYLYNGANGYNYGQVQTLTGPGGSLVQAIKAPFCWPNATGPYGAAQDMSAAKYFNVAAVMQRWAVYGEAYDAVTGLPLAGATIRTLYQKPGSIYGVIQDTTKITAKTPGFYFLNLSTTDLGSFWLQVSKSGYTASYQTYGWFQPLAGGDGIISFEVGSSVAVPPASNISAVLNWLPYPDTNLDLHVWLPADAPAAVQGYVSPGWLPKYIPGYNRAPSLDQGALIAPANPSMPASPYAQVMHDGGAEGFATDILTFDTITIKAKSNGAPWFSGGTITQPYKFYVTDYSKVYPGQNANDFQYPHSLDLNPSNPNGTYGEPFAFPILRVWVKGKLPWDNIVDLSQNAILPNTDPKQLNPACTSGNDWWHPADLGVSGLVRTPVDQACGNELGGNYLP